jgi:hypothetical protein
VRADGRERLQHNELGERPAGTDDGSVGVFGSGTLDALRK